MTTEPNHRGDVKLEPIADPVPKRAKSDQVCEPAILSLMKLNPEASIVPELKPFLESDQVCEPVPCLFLW